MNSQEMQQRLRHLRKLLAHEDEIKRMADNYRHFLEGEDALKLLPVRMGTEKPGRVHQAGWSWVRNILLGTEDVNKSKHDVPDGG